MYLMSDIRDGLPQVRITVSAGLQRAWRSEAETWRGSVGRTAFSRAAAAAAASGPPSARRISSSSLSGIPKTCRMTLLARPVPSRGSSRSCAVGRLTEGT